MNAKSKEFVALLGVIQVIIIALDKKGIIPKEELGNTFRFCAEEHFAKEEPVIYETLQFMAEKCNPKKKGSHVDLTLITNNDEDTEPDK